MGATCFSTVASDLVANDTNGASDVFVRDLRPASPASTPTPTPTPTNALPGDFVVATDDASCPFDATHCTYQIDSGGGAQTNPTLSVVRGATYVFALTDNVDHTFALKTAPGIGPLNQYLAGVTGNACPSCTSLTWTVSCDAPDTLYYNCLYHPQMAGSISVSGSACTPTPTTIPVPTPTPTATALPCVGDCGGALGTTIDEVQHCVNIFLGTQAVTTCNACDRNHNTVVSIDEVQAAVNAFLADPSTCPRVAL